MAGNKAGFFSNGRRKRKKTVAKSPPLQSVIPYLVWLDNTYIQAKRIRYLHNGEQLFTRAQLEIALCAFRDFDKLEEEQINPVDFTEIYNTPPEYVVGFDWLDLAVSYKDPDAIAYFKSRLGEKEFFEQYQNYVRTIRSECDLRKHVPDKISEPPKESSAPATKRARR